MADETTLQRTASRVEQLARPRASAGLVALVVLIAEMVAGLTAWGVSSLDTERADPLLTTLAVVAAAVTALTLFVRTGQASEPGNGWLAAAWLVIAVMAGAIVTDLPLAVTLNPAGPGTDRALLTVLTWTLVLAISVLGADLRPDARYLPWIVTVVFGGLGTLGGLTIPDGALLGRSGPTFGYGLIGGMVAIVAVGSCAWWLHRWEERGGWALTWTGVGLVLMTAGLMLQLVASYGGDRAWAAATSLILSSLVVPSVGAAVAGLGMAGAHSLARRELAQGLEAALIEPSVVEADDDATDSVGNLPMLESLDVQLATVVNVATGDPSGAIATARLPGTGLELDWWRAQAASMNLAEKFEVVLATRALEVARRERADAWLVMPLAAAGMSPALMDLLSGPRAGQLVAVLEGGGKPNLKATLKVLSDLRERGVNTGLQVSRIDTKVLETVAATAPSLLVVGGRTVQGVATDTQCHAAVADVVAFANEHSMAVLATGVDDPKTLPVIRELGVRYASGEAVLALKAPAPAAHPAVATAAMELIEAAGLRRQAGSDRR